MSHWRNPEKMLVEFTFTRALDSDADRDRFVKLLSDEIVVVYGKDDNYPEMDIQKVVKQGWGMGQAMLIGLKRMVNGKPERAHMNQDLGVSLVPRIAAARMPEDPVHGRFLLRGRVLSGIKPARGRMVEIALTHDQLQTLVNDGAEALLRWPKMGITPTEND